MDRAALGTLQEPVILYKVVELQVKNYWVLEVCLINWQERQDQWQTLEILHLMLVNRNNLPLDTGLDFIKCHLMLKSYQKLYQKSQMITRILFSELLMTQNKLLKMVTFRRSQPFTVKEQNLKKTLNIIQKLYRITRKLLNLMNSCTTLLIILQCVYKNLIIRKKLQNGTLQP